MIDTDKSLEEIENDYWGEYIFDSYPVFTCHKARQKPIKDLSKEEIRCFVAQRTSLKYILPLAVDILKEEPFVEITFFEGDLLCTLLRLDIDDWKHNENELNEFKKILQQNLTQIEKCDDIPNDLIEKYI